MAAILAVQIQISFNAESFIGQYWIHWLSLRRGSESLRALGFSLKVGKWQNPQLDLWDPRANVVYVLGTILHGKLCRSAHHLYHILEWNDSNYIEWCKAWLPRASWRQAPSLCNHRMTQKDQEQEKEVRGLEGVLTFEPKITWTKDQEQMGVWSLQGCQKAKMLGQTANSPRSLFSS